MEKKIKEVLNELHDNIVEIWEEGGQHHDSYPTRTDILVAQATSQLKALFVEAVDKTDLYTLFGNYLSRGVINKIDIPDLIEAAKSEIRARIEGGAK